MFCFCNADFALILFLIIGMNKTTLTLMCANFVMKYMFYIQVKELVHAQEFIFYSGKILQNKIQRSIDIDCLAKFFPMPPNVSYGLKIQ